HRYRHGGGQGGRGAKTRKRPRRGGRSMGGGPKGSTLVPCPPFPLFSQKETPLSDRTSPDSLQQHILHPRAPGACKHRSRMQIDTAQGAGMKVNGREVVNFCANNCLGLANLPAILDAAADALRRFGYGMASVRFICGTQTLHKELESAIAAFLKKDDAILYSS